METLLELLLPGPPLEGHGQGDVLPQGEGVQEVVVLEDEVQSGAELVS